MNRFIKCKQRILVMPSLLKLGLMTTAIVVAFSCQTDNFFDAKNTPEMPEGWKIMNTNDQKAASLLERNIQRLKKEYPEYEFYRIRFTSDAVLNGNRFWMIRMFSPGYRVGVAQYYPYGNSPLKDLRNIQLYDESNHDNETFSVVEEKPQPQEGMAAFNQYIRSNLKYPEQAKINGIEGKVYVQFVVNKEGGIEQVQSLVGIGGGCDEEAVRLISGSPVWIPGKQEGKAVKVRMLLPVLFSLREQSNETSQPRPPLQFFSYLRNELRYPEKARELHIEGKVQVRCTVNPDGSLSDPQVVKGIGSGCDEEAVRLISNAPKWIPGKERIAYKIVIPVEFLLR